MASNTQSVLLVFFTSILELVRGYYCDNDKCLEEEFCCGENICCGSYKVWELWYFWCGILFCVFLLSLCGCFWGQKQRAYWIFRTPGAPYSPVPVDHEDTKYNPNRKDPYSIQKERSLSPTSFYTPTQKQTSWYSPHNNPSPPPYTDNDELYDTGTEKENIY